MTKRFLMLLLAACTGLNMAMAQVQKVDTTILTDDDIPVVPVNGKRLAAKQPGKTPVKQKSVTQARVPQNELSKYLLVLPANNPYTGKADTVSLPYLSYLEAVRPLYEGTFSGIGVPYDAAYYRLFTPMAYYTSPIASVSTLAKPNSDWQNADSLLAVSLLPVDKDPFLQIDRTNGQMDKALLSLYLAHPELVYSTEDRIMSRRIYQAEALSEEPQKSDFVKLFEPEKMVEDVGTAEMLIHKPNWWTTGGEFALQMSQVHISDNWYKGGESNYSGLATINLFANYNDREKVLFENYLNAQVGLGSTPSDEFHKYLITTDQIRIGSKLGLQAHKNWYYTLTATFKSQGFNGYKPNSPTLVSALLSPADLNVGLGMDYKFKNKKVDFSIVLAPFTYNMRYVMNKHINPVTFGLPEGKRIKHDFGSQIEPKLKWKVNPYVYFESYLNYLTNYRFVRVEWENTVNFVLNRYFSTKLFVHTRFDDSAPPLEGSSRIQLKELLTFGINYKW